MDWSSEHRRGPTALGLASIVALWFGCFDGAGALGYPCATDDDCGPSLTCESTGCCGGECLFGSSSTGDSTTTESTTEDSTTSSSTIDPTTEDGSESSSSTGLPDPVCGNGVTEEGEECDDGDAANGYWEPCAPDCRRTILHFTSTEEGNEDFCDPASQCDPRWQRVDGQTGPWGSGPYGDDMQPTTYQLVTREFRIPEPAEIGLVPQVEIRHELFFDVCEITPGEPEYFDGARVLLWATETDEYLPLSPQQLDLHKAAPSCGTSDTPWCELKEPPELVFVGDSMGPRTARTARIPMPVANGPLRLVFEVAFDSPNCKGGPGELPDPWKLHRVVVALAPLLD